MSVYISGHSSAELNLPLNSCRSSCRLGREVRFSVTRPTALLRMHRNRINLPSTGFLSHGCIRLWIASCKNLSSAMILRLRLSSLCSCCQNLGTAWLSGGENSTSPMRCATPTWTTFLPRRQGSRLPTQCMLTSESFSSLLTSRQGCED